VEPLNSKWLRKTFVEAGNYIFQEYFSGFFFLFLIEKYFLSKNKKSNSVLPSTNPKNVTGI
jgi:hypothetical protein